MNSTTDKVSKLSRQNYLCDFHLSGAAVRGGASRQLTKSRDFPAKIISVTSISGAAVRGGGGGALRQLTKSQDFPAKFIALTSISGAAVEVEGVGGAGGPS